MCDHTLDRYSPRPFLKKTTKNKQTRRADQRLARLMSFFFNELNAGDDGNECPAASNPDQGHGLNHDVVVAGDCCS